MKAENELACSHTIDGIAYGLPCASVPDDDLTSTILFRRYGSLEACVVERVVLDMHGHALRFRVVARPLRHCPRQEDAARLKPEIVMQAARPVLLDDERRRP